MNLAIIYDDPEKGQDAAARGDGTDQPDGTEEEGEDVKIV